MIEFIRVKVKTEAGDYSELHRADLGTIELVVNSLGHLMVGPAAFGGLAPPYKIEITHDGDSHHQQGSGQEAPSAKAYEVPTMPAQPWVQQPQVTQGKIR